MYNLCSNLSWQTKIVGTSFACIQNTAALGFFSSEGEVALCAFEGSSVTNGIVARGSTVSVIASVFYGFLTNTTSVNSTITLNGNRTATNPIFTGMTVDYDVGNFSLATNDAIGIVNIAALATLDAALPTLIATDYLLNTRSTLRYNGGNSADAGAIESVFLNTSFSYTETCDTPICIFTDQGRNTLIRSLMGECTVQAVGYAFGRSGYNFYNPTSVNPVVLHATYASNSLTIVNNTFDPSTTWSVNSVPFQVGSEFNLGTNAAITAFNLSTAINNSTVDGVVKRVLSSAQGPTVNLTAIPCGTIGNTFTLAFNSEYMTNCILASANFFGGSNETSLVDPIWPTNGYFDLTSIEEPNQTAASFIARLGEFDSNYALGEFGIYATITESQLPVETTNSPFLLMVGHMPIHAKNDTEVVIARGITQF